MVLTHYRIAYALHRTDHVMDLIFDAVLRPVGITVAQARVLLHLDRYPTATMAELSRLASVTPQTMHRLVVGLERREIVQRQPLDDDKKALKVALTEKGAEVLRQAEVVLKKEQDPVLEHFDLAELDQFLDFLERFEQVYSSRQGVA